jgi:hypothetical protein
MQLRSKEGADKVCLLSQGVVLLSTNTNDAAFFMYVFKIAKSDYWIRHVCSSVRPSLRME